MYPTNMKNQGDWAFCMGINKFVYHTFAHQPFADSLRPGMTMGPYGIHHDRGQTWWPMASAYHRYVARSQYLLRQGRTVADILYLAPEGAPNVFRPPLSALEGDAVLPDKRGYNFDGCSPLALIKLADVHEKRIIFPGGASYGVLVLPDFKTMTPELLEKLEQLIMKGAVVVGNPPVKSPGLTGYPQCDDQVRSLAVKMWGSQEIPEKETKRSYGKGMIYWGGDYSKTDTAGLYPYYNVIAKLLKNMGIEEDFRASGSIRYTHRTTDDRDIYFISNRTNTAVRDTCIFRVGSGRPELWDPVTGETRFLNLFKRQNGLTFIPLTFDNAQSFFIVFSKNDETGDVPYFDGKNFPEEIAAKMLQGPWSVSFDPKWGGPAEVIFKELEDWTKRPEEGIRYYSGIAVYFKKFDLPKDLLPDGNAELYIDLQEVNNMARVKLNGKDLGVVWTAPWQVRITEAIREKDNELEIEVANLWMNRLIGDEQFPDDGVKDGKWPAWLLEGKPRTSGRYTFTTNRFYKKGMPLRPSGLIGPVRILKAGYN